jgi:hypothetical protein
MIIIEWIHGRPANGAHDDEERAVAAAEAVLDGAGLGHAAAGAEYMRQWLEFDDEGPMHGAALVWIQARNAADLALTEGWDKPDGAHCTIEIG